MKGVLGIKMKIYIIFIKKTYIHWTIGWQPYIVFTGNQFLKSAEKIKDLLWPEVNLCPLNLRPPCRDTTSTHTHTLNSETDKVWQTDLHMLRIGWTKPINQRQTKYDRLTCTDRVRPSQCSSSVPHARLMFTDLVCPSQCSSSIPHAKPMTDWRLQTWCVEVNVQSCLLSSYVPSVHGTNDKDQRQIPHFMPSFLIC